MFKKEQQKAPAPLSHYVCHIHLDNLLDFLSWILNICNLQTCVFSPKSICQEPMPESCYKLLIDYISVLLAF